MSGITYNKDFIKRTRELLKNHFSKLEKEDLEVTFLMNCLLGLIVSISENKGYFNKVLDNNIDEDFLSNLPKNICFIKLNKSTVNLINCSESNIKLKISKKVDLKNYKKKWFINKLRNGIAHQHINEINDNDNDNDNEKWIGVEIWNETKSNIIDFRISFQIKELYDFVLFLSEQFINTNSIHNKEEKK